MYSFCVSTAQAHHKVSLVVSELANYEKNVNRAMHKFNAYRKAAGVIAKHETSIATGDEAKKLVGAFCVQQRSRSALGECLLLGDSARGRVRGGSDAIRTSQNSVSHVESLCARVCKSFSFFCLYPSQPGVGEKIAKKIEEFIKTGKLEKLEKV